MIEFACQCGNSMRAPEALGGRKTKCPKCGIMVVIPGNLRPAIRPPSKVLLYNTIGYKARDRTFMCEADRIMYEKAEAEGRIVSHNVGGVVRTTKRLIDR